jgi:hypothetical protein
MDVNPEDEGSFTAQYKVAFLKYVEHDYCSKNHIMPNYILKMPNHNDPFSTSRVSGPGHSYYDPYDWSSDDAEYLTPANMVESTPGRSHRTARLLTATTLYLNSPPEAPRRWGQINPNLNDYHTDAMEVSSAFWMPDITDWWRNQGILNTKYTDLDDVACEIFSIMPHGVGVEASFSLGRDVIGWKQSKTTGQTLSEKVVVHQFARSNAGLLAADILITHPLDPDNDAEIKKEAEQKKPQRTAKVHDFLEMWLGSENLHSTQKAMHTQNPQMTAMGYISDTEETVESCESAFEYDGAAAFRLSEKSPLAPTLSQIDLPGGKTKLLNIHHI